jgi:hypothetical protein
MTPCRGSRSVYSWLHLLMAGWLAAAGTGCVSETTAGGDDVVTLQKELYLFGPTWPSGVIPVCWSSGSIARSDYLTQAAVVKTRAHEEWPTAAKISFVGWNPCTTNTGGKVVLDLVDDGSGFSTTIGYQGATATHFVHLGVLRGDFGGSLVPHELGHVLGFQHEMNRPDFNEPSCDGTDTPGGDTLGTAPDVNSIMASTGYCQNLPHLSTIDRQGVAVAYAATTSRFLSTTFWTTWSIDFDHRFADVDGDGRADIVGRSGTDVKVGLSTGTGFASSSSWTSWGTAYDLQLADVDGDGRADIVGRSGNDVQVGLSTGSGFAASTQWTTWDTAYTLQLADVNGDGRADIIGRRSDGVVHVGLSTGSGFAESSQWTTWDTAYTPLQLADVNGDGRADIVGRRSDGDVQVGLSTGSAFAGSSQWTTWSTAYDLQLADVNGDGRADVVGRSGTDVQVGASTGTGFAGSTAWTTWNTSFDMQLADVNGDGPADTVGRSGNSVRVGLASN